MTELGPTAIVPMLGRVDRMNELGATAIVPTDLQRGFVMKEGADIWRMPSASDDADEAASDTTLFVSPLPARRRGSGLPVQAVGVDLERDTLDETVPLALRRGGSSGSHQTDSPQTQQQAESPQDAGLGTNTVQVGTHVLAELCAQQAARIAELEQQLEWQRMTAAQEGEGRLVQELREAAARCTRTQESCDARFEQLFAAQAHLQAENQDLAAQVRISAQGLETLRREVQSLQAQGLNRSTCTVSPMSMSRHRHNMDEDSALRVDMKDIAPTRPPSPVRVPMAVATPAWSSSSSVLAAVSPLARTANGSVVPTPVAASSSVSLVHPPEREVPEGVNSGGGRLPIRSPAASVSTPAHVPRGSGMSSPGQVRKIRHAAAGIRNTSPVPPVRLAAPPPLASSGTAGSRGGTTSLSPRSATGGNMSPRGKSPLPGLAVSAVRQMRTPAQMRPGSVATASVGSNGSVVSARSTSQLISGRRSSSVTQL